MSRLASSLAAEESRNFEVVLRLGSPRRAAARIEKVTAFGTA
jgi:hypothetical protein